MNVLSSVTLLLTLFLLPVTSVTEVTEDEIRETFQERQRAQ